MSVNQLVYWQNRAVHLSQRVARRKQVRTVHRSQRVARRRLVRLIGLSTGMEKFETSGISGNRYTAIPIPNIIEASTLLFQEPRLILQPLHETANEPAANNMHKICRSPTVLILTSNRRAVLPLLPRLPLYKNCAVEVSRREQR